MANEFAKLSPEQLLAIAKASSAAEIAEICKGDWRPPNIDEQMAEQAMRAMQKREATSVKKFPYRANNDGFLEPIE
jgi:hypothetical protein